MRHTVIVPAVGAAPESQSWKAFPSLQLEECQFQLATTPQTSLGTDDGAQWRSAPTARCANGRCPARSVSGKQNGDKISAFH